ncbi:HGGxSTG domain-containing protein [Hwanghaeella sp. 1Z406]|uniref:HGGxSTG domain-containing protein n=1 Tax=Hwanghaeella sp. 1Z406 TaxID=3402811 RepID=UPI003B6832B0
MNSAPRCLAKTRKGTFCQCPAIKGKGRCRLHGGKSTGAPKGNTNALKHGHWTKAAIRDREHIREILQAHKEIMAMVG